MTYLSDKIKHRILKKSFINNRITYNLSDKVLIFDTYCGLCNQFFDIHFGINYCLANNIKFTFRNATFRNDNLTTWYKVNFDEIFDKSFLTKYDLYVDYDTLKLNNENTSNYDGKNHARQLLKNDINNLYHIDKQYIVLYGIFTLLINKISITKQIYDEILPSPKIMNTYLNIRDKLKLSNNNYNFIHYRYEHDFVIAFNIPRMTTLESLIYKLNFKDNNKKIFIASTNIDFLLKNSHIRKEVIYKNESELTNLNFEQRAYIDFLFGKNSCEVYGHPKSSFSMILNIFKNTENYY